METQASFLTSISAVPKFPSTRYQGSKAKIAEWIIARLKEFDCTSCLDAFGGTGAIAYHLKTQGKRVTYNDLLRFNYYIGVALIENKEMRLSDDDIEWILTRHDDIEYPHFIANTFKDIYFTDEENDWLDQTITNIYRIEDKYKFALAFFALSQACIIKRPYNLFHRRNLYVRLAEVERSFGNKATWDKPFEMWFRYFCREANDAVFDNHQENKAVNCDAINVEGHYDLVYIDTPYVSSRGSAVDYRDFYHFLEGLTIYHDWERNIEFSSKHRRLTRIKNEWSDKRTIYRAFEKLFERYSSSTLAISYRSDGIPSEQELVSMLKNFKSKVIVEHYGQYKYVLSKNSNSKEILIIATD